MKKKVSNKPVLTTEDCNKALIEVAKPLTYGGIVIAIIMGDLVWSYQSKHSNDATGRLYALCDRVWGVCNSYTKKSKV